MKNQWKLVAVIVLLVIIIAFAVLNGDQVPVNFGFGEVAAPLIMIMLISLLFGSLITLLVSTLTTTRDHKELKELRKRVAQQDQQLQEAVKRVRNEYESKIQALEQTLAERDQTVPLNEQTTDFEQ